MEFPPIEPILGPFATQQLSLLFAPTGVGKTMFGAAVAYAMAEGRDFVGWKSSGPRKVLYVDAEMAARMMQERFLQASSENLYVANLPGWWADAGGGAVNLTTDEAQDLLNIWINAIGADVIFLDNFMSLAWRDGTSFSSDEIWTPLRRWMLAQRAANRSVILIDHANAQSKVFGTKTKTHIMDLIGVLEGQDDPESEPESGVIHSAWVTLKWEKRRGYRESSPEVIHKDLKLAPVGIDWEWTVPTDPLLRDITALRKEGISIRDIAKELGVSYSKVQRIWRRVQVSDSQ